MKLTERKFRFSNQQCGFCKGRYILGMEAVDMSILIASPKENKIHTTTICLGKNPGTGIYFGVAINDQLSSQTDLLKDWS